MDKFREYPYLFANGKFKVKHGKEDALYPLVYARPSKDFGWLIHTSPSFWAPADTFSLIARPISDMTDKEVKSAAEYAGMHETNDYKKWWAKVANEDQLTFKMSRYLLSMGIYPFSQSHFHDGTVIDKTDQS